MGVVVGIDGALGRTAESIPGGPEVEGRRDDDVEAPGDTFADLLDDDRIVADGHVRTVGFDATGGYEQRPVAGHGVA